MGAFVARLEQGPLIVLILLLEFAVVFGVSNVGVNLNIGSIYSRQQRKTYRPSRLGADGEGRAYSRRRREGRNDIVMETGRFFLSVIDEDAW